jgi:hypothetical protein
MLRIQVYPTMGGVEVWCAGSCLEQEPGHEEHSGKNAAQYISREEIEEKTTITAVANVIVDLLRAHPEVAARAHC